MSESLSSLYPRTALAAIDGDAERGAYPCRLGGAYWNGWDCPAFPLASVRAMAAAMRHDDGTPVIRLEETADPDAPRVVMVSGPDDCDWPSLERWPDTVHDAIVIDGVRHWTIGAWGWVWSEVPVCAEAGCEAFGYWNGRCETHDAEHDADDADTLGGAE